MKLPHSPMLSQWIKKRYGSKKGLLSLTRHQALWYVGYYKKFANIEFEKVNRVIFICEGNICRSPISEIVARFYGVNAQSFGLSCTDNNPADPRAREFANSIGLDLSAHRTRNICHYRPDPNDLLVGMEPRHIKKLAKLFGNEVNSTLLGLFHLPRVTYIHDPYNTNPIFFARCEQQVVEATKGLILKAPTRHEARNRP